MTERYRLRELLALGGCAFILTQAVLSLVLSPGDSPNDGNVVWKLILGVSYLAVAIILVEHYHKTVFFLRRNLVLMALVALAFASCLWASVPALVLQRGLAVFGTTLLGIGLAVRLPLEDQLRLMSWVFRIITILSLLCIVLLPSYGITDSFESHGEWRGIFSHKNQLGSAMALSVLVESQLPVDTRFGKIARVVAMLLSALLLVRSNSLTAMLALSGSLLLAGLYKFSAQCLRMPAYAIVFVAMLLLASGTPLLFANSDGATGVLGRSSDLTGRGQIWSLVLSYAMQRPLLGYGYSGFWSGASPQSITINQAMGTEIMYSHNGYLEMFLVLGAPGLFLALAFLGVGVRRALRYSEFSRSNVRLWPLAFLSFFLLYNLTECTILFQGLEWALCVATIVAADPARVLLYAEEDDEPALSPAEQLA